MKNLYPTKIRSKLILLGVLAFLPVVLLTVFTSWHLRKLEIEEARERMAKILDFAILHEEEVIRETHRILSVLAEVPFVRDGGNRSDEFLARFLKSSPAYANFGIARLDGRVVASALPMKEPVNISDRLYFKETLRTRAFSVGQYQVGRITETPVINFGYPLLGPQGNVTGIVFAALNLSLVTQFESLIDVQTPKDSTYVKLDGNGAVLTSYPESQMFGRGHPLEKSLFEKISKEKRGTFQAVGADGVERLYLFSSFLGPLNKNEGYALLGIPARELFTEVNRVLVVELAALAVIGVLFLAVAWLGGDSLIVRPVGALVDATKRLAGGDLTARSGLVSKEGEIGELGRAFDEMAERLERGDHESRRMQEKVRESEERFRNIFRENRSVMLVVDPETARIQDANPAAAAFYGYPEESLRNMTIGQINTLPETEIAAELARALRKERDRFIFPHRLANGEIRTVEVHSSPVKAGERFLLFSIIHDITENRKLEEQARQSQKMESVGRLAGGIAHDFNNLLTVITGYSELLLKRFGKESPMRGEVEEIRRAGERAATLTQQLLAFSRKQIIEPKVVHLDSLVTEMHRMLGRLIGENIELQAITGKALGSVKVDPGQFQQILMNLALNARDAMPDGGKIVIETSNVELDAGYCTLHPYVKPGRFVMLSVSDTGTGMTDEVKAHIFEPFFTTKETGSGTGLGLAMTYGAVHQAGGTIEVYSEVGIGTAFKIYLPRIEAAAGEPEKEDRPADLPGGTETVLVVEDEDIVRNLCVRILEQLGYKVLHARDGKEAIAVAQGNGDPIDLLLTDVVMPGMNGSELATQLVLHHPEAKVLFTSGYTDDAITRHGILDEGVSFLGKPYTPSALARKVREVLE
jgi:PAS domain S-box-containing protein